MAVGPGCRAVRGCRPGKRARGLPGHGRPGRGRGRRRRRGGGALGRAGALRAAAGRRYAAAGPGGGRRRPPSDPEGPAAAAAEAGGGAGGPGERALGVRGVASRGFGDALHAVAWPGASLVTAAWGSCCEEGALSQAPPRQGPERGDPGQSCGAAGHPGPSAAALPRHARPGPPRPLPRFVWRYLVGRCLSKIRTLCCGLAKIF